MAKHTGNLTPVVFIQKQNSSLNLPPAEKRQFYEAGVIKKVLYHKTDYLMDKQLRNRATTGICLHDL